MIDGIFSVAGMFPIAVTTRLNERVYSTFDVNLTFVVSNIAASLPIIEYA